MDRTRRSSSRGTCLSCQVPPNGARFLEDEEVLPAFAGQGVNGHAHASGAVSSSWRAGEERGMVGTGDAGADQDGGGVGVGFLANGDSGSGFRVGHGCGRSGSWV
jgi:hypothetical protein